MPNKRHNPYNDKGRSNDSDSSKSHRDGQRDDNGDFSEDRGSGNTKIRDNNILSAPDRWENPWDKGKDNDSSKN